ncbi:MAG: hypothetical protein BroJett011_13680 [Chloroflexota bacterium]|nr:MAG: hypothetical protein BroJett011_13680 [Chloroflexota bacterium]
MKHSKRNQLMLVMMMALTVLILAACAAASQSGDTSQAPGAANSIPVETSGETPESNAPPMEATVVAMPTTEPTTNESEPGNAPATSETDSGEMMGDGQMAGGEFDQMFIDMMVPHHQSAIEMARVEQQQGENPELKQMAESMIQSQQAEIDQLRQWRQEWYGSSETPPMTQMPMLPGMAGMGHEGDMMTMDMTTDIERVRNAPKPIDATFIEAMTQHHQMAIEAATMAEQQATHQEIKDMARNIIEEQQQEISEMERIRQELAEQSAESLVTPTP